MSHEERRSDRAWPKFAANCGVEVRDALDGLAGRTFDAEPASIVTLPPNEGVDADNLGARDRPSSNAVHHAHRFVVELKPSVEPLVCADDRADDRADDQQRHNANGSRV